MPKKPFQYLEESDKSFDAVFLDLPDPNNESLNKLYTKEFYSLVRNHLEPKGIMMAQATSPVFATEVYWTINETVKATGMNTYNFHVDVPSFGNWGFVMASREDIDVEEASIGVETEFLTEEVVSALTVFGKDTDGEIIDSDGQVKNLEPNTLIHPNLIQKYEKAWEHY